MPRRSKRGRDAAAVGLQALIVMRHDYIVYERYGHGVNADTMIDSGAFAQVLLALAAGIAAHDDSLALASLSGFDAARLRAAIEAGARTELIRTICRCDCGAGSMPRRPGLRCRPPARARRPTAAFTRACRIGCASPSLLAR